MKYQLIIIMTIFRQILSTILSSHSEKLNDLVDAPLVTVGVTGV